MRALRTWQQFWLAALALAAVVCGTLEHEDLILRPVPAETVPATEPDAPELATFGELHHESGTTSAFRSESRLFSLARNLPRALALRQPRFLALAAEASFPPGAQIPPRVRMVGVVELRL